MERSAWRCRGRKSWSENDRKVRSKPGNKFPAGPPYDRFTPAIAAALKAEFGGSRAAVKSVVRLTGANERTVRNWFEGNNGPGGDNLVALIRHSDTVLRTVLILANRPDLAVLRDVINLRSQMRALLQALDDLPAD